MLLYPISKEHIFMEAFVLFYKGYFIFIWLQFLSGYEVGMGQ